MKSKSLPIILVLLSFLLLIFTACRLEGDIERPLSFTVRFESNGGAAVAPITNISPGQTISQPPDPYKQYFELVDWYKDPGLTQVWDFGTDTVVSNITLYAEWEWDQNEGTGEDDDPFVVYDETTLRKVGREAVATNAWDLTKHYKQITDITLITGDWTPIGTYNTNPFTGSYDGNGNTISGLTINVSVNGKGMFSYIAGDGMSSGVVRNLGLIGNSVIGVQFVGGFVGLNNGGKVQNCYVTGSVEGRYDVGGIVGENRGTVENCYVTGNLKGYDGIGGVVGYNNGGRLENCYTISNVTGTFVRVGGLVGWSSGTIQNCYATGSVEGFHYVGGIVGENGGTAENCYVTGSLKGYDGTGGVVGYNYGSIQNCVALSSDIRMISNDISIIGRIVGEHTAGTLTNNYARSDMKLYYDTDTNYEGTTQKIVAVASDLHNGVDGKGIGPAQYNNASWWKNAANWDTSGWDFSTVWRMGSNGLPVLIGVGEGK